MVSAQVSPIKAFSEPVQFLPNLFHFQKVRFDGFKSRIERFQFSVGQPEHNAGHGVLLV